jgi:hypothetical protein
VCNNDTGVCQSGCGTVNGTFLCFSQDTDGDGLADYFDPDIDGDGIPNAQDLDKDGDGVEDKDYSDTPSGGGGGGANVNMAGVERRLDDIKGLLTSTPYSGKKASDLAAAEQQVDDAFTALTTAGNKTMAESGGVVLQDTDIQFINTFVGSLPLASCTNPIIYGKVLNFCSKAPLINEWLYWLIAALTIIAVFHELNDTLRRK